MTAAVEYEGKQTQSVVISDVQYYSNKATVKDLKENTTYYYQVFQNGQWQDAQKYLEEYSSASDMMVSPAAQAALGNAYAQNGNIDKAVSCLKKAADMADSKAEDDTNNSIAPTFLLQAGELLESQNNKAEALKIYQDIKKKYVNSQLVQSYEIDKYIERVSE